MSLLDAYLARTGGLMPKKKSDKRFNQRCPKCGEVTEQTYVCPECMAEGCVESCNSGGNNCICMACEETREQEG